jgi:beta-phosphoglucomutase
MVDSSVFAVIWDLDGTLVDTAELHFHAWLELTRQIKKPFSRDDFATTFGLRNPEIIHQLFGTEYTEREVVELGERKEELYRADARRHGVALLPGARELLEGLRSKGFKQAIGSSAPRANLELILRLTGAAQFFQAIVGAEETQRGKPDPQVFLVAAEKLTVPPAHCLVLEDAVAGIQAAKAGGMKSIAVRLGGHHSETKLLQAGADRVVPSLRDIPVEMVQELLAEASGH